MCKSSNKQPYSSRQDPDTLHSVGDQTYLSWKNQESMNVSCWKYATEPHDHHTLEWTLEIKGIQGQNPTDWGFNIQS